MSKNVTWPDLPLAAWSETCEFRQRLRRLGIDIWTMPSEIENAIPFDKDHDLPYDAVFRSSDGFLQETYVAAAELAKWDRKALERERAIR